MIRSARQFLATYPLTLGWVVLMVGMYVIDEPRMRFVSTGETNLFDHPVRTLIGSFFVVGSFAALVHWLTAGVLIAATLERAMSRPRLVTVVVAGHVLATLLVMVLRHFADSHPSPASLLVNPPSDLGSRCSGGRRQLRRLVVPVREK